MKVASISHSADGYAVEIAEIPLRWVLAGRVADAFLSLTGHVLCCEPPGFAYHLRWGRADEDGWTARSAGHLMWAAGQWLSCCEFRHESRQALIPVTAEWVQEHYPEIRAEMRFLEDGPDAMTATFSK